MSQFWPFLDEPLKLCSSVALMATPCPTSFDQRTEGARWTILGQTVTAVNPPFHAICVDGGICLASFEKEIAYGFPQDPGNITPNGACIAPVIYNMYGAWSPSKCIKPQRMLSDGISPIIQSIAWYRILTVPTCSVFPHWTLQHEVLAVCSTLPGFPV